MDCLRCNNEVTSPGKALCDSCLAGSPALPEDTQKIQKSMRKLIDVHKRVSEFNYAGFWLRTLAVIIDAGLMVSILKFVWWSAVAYWGNSALNFLSTHLYNFVNPSYETMTRSLSGAVWLCLLPVVLYSCIFEASPLHATPGKAILGLKVTNLDGDNLNILRSLIRSLSRFSNLVPFISVLLVYASAPLTAGTITMLSLFSSAVIIPYSFIMVAFTEQKQALHDKLISTLVVKRSGFNKKHVIVGLLLLLLIIASAAYSFSQSDKAKFYKKEIIQRIWDKR